MQRVIQAKKECYGLGNTALIGIIDWPVKASRDSITHCTRWLVKTSPLGTGFFFFFFYSCFSSVIMSFKMRVSILQSMQYVITKD